MENYVVLFITGIFLSDILLYKILKLYIIYHTLPPRTEAEYRVILEKKIVFYDREKRRRISHIYKTLLYTLFSLIFLFDSLSISSTTIDVPIREEELIILVNETVGNENISSCFAVEYDRECYLENSAMWSIEKYTNNSIEGKQIRKIPAILHAKDRSYFVDENRKIYYMENTVIHNHESGDISVEKRVISESYLIEQLNTLYNENNGEKCICPVYLGIWDNVSFIKYRENQWIIMNDPMISTIPGDAREISTRVYYSKDSQFRNYVKDHTTRNKHYDKFIISFSSISLMEEEKESLSIIDRKNDKERNGKILKRVKQDGEIRRISLLLEGQDAICFIHCQTQQEKTFFLW